MEVNSEQYDPWLQREEERKWDLKVAMAVFMAILVFSAIVFRMRDVFQRK